MLTPQQEKFAQLVASGKTQADAYRGAYKVRETTKPESVFQKASQLMADVKIRSRVSELKSELASKALWTREDSVRALKNVLDVDPASGVAVSAIKELNLMHGFNAPIKQEISGNMNNKVEIVLIDS